MSLRMSVCPSGVILFSLEHLKHLEDVLRELQGYVKKFIGCFKAVSKMI